MTSKTAATLLADLQDHPVTFPPRVSKRQSLLEAWFKTLKYAPVFPERFGSLEMPARSWTASSTTTTMNTSTPASDYTPTDVHYGLAAAKNHRRATVATARPPTHPLRRTHRDAQNPQTPTEAWINQPPTRHGRTRNPQPPYLAPMVQISLTNSGSASAWGMGGEPAWLATGLSGLR